MMCFQKISPIIPKSDLILGIVILFLLPFLNSIGVLGDYYLGLLGKYLCFAILAVGMDLIWGFTGILSLGQAVFFGLGAYAMGMYLMLEGTGQGTYGEPIPDFMVWNQVTELPLFWKPYQSFAWAGFTALALPAAVAALIGYLTFRRRVSGTYFAILTQAVAFVAWLMFNRNEMNLGGTNGLTDFKTILGFELGQPQTQRWLYWSTALCLMLVLSACRWLIGSRTGLVLTAIREQERRLEYLGYSVTAYKIFVFTVAAALAGLAGALYVPQVGIITPNQIGVLPSLEIVVWVAAGGRGTLMGAILGAVSVNAARSFLTAQYPEWWPVILGALFVSVILFVPGGLVGIFSQVGCGMRRLGGMAIPSRMLRLRNILGVGGSARHRSTE